MKYINILKIYHIEKIYIEIIIGYILDFHTFIKNFKIQKFRECIKRKKFCKISII